jgi:hypothetical protein
MGRGVFKMKRGCLNHIGPEFLPSVRLGEDGMTECVGTITALLRVTNFEDQLHILKNT